MGGLKRGPKPGTPEMQALMKAKREEKNRIAARVRRRARRAEKKRMKLEQALPDPGSAVARAGYGSISQGVIDQKRAALGERAAKARGSVAEVLALCAMANSDVEPVGVPNEPLVNAIHEAFLEKFQEAFASLALEASGPPSADARSNADDVSASALASTTAPGDAGTDDVGAGDLSAGSGSTAKPCIALFGFSFPLQHRGASYQTMIEKAKRSQSVPGHFRDRARILRMQEMGYDFCCVSLNSEDQDLTKHYEGNFCNASRFIRGFKQFLDKNGMGEGNRPLQICVDWYWLPPGYDNDRIMQEGFFRDTLPLIASRGILSKKGDGEREDVPSGTVWVPYTLNVVKYIFKHQDLLEEFYLISYVGKELLIKEHAMYKATRSMSSEDMEIFGKKKDDGKVSEWRNVSSAGWAKQKISAADGIDEDGFEEYVKEIHSENTLMVKLQLI